MGCCTSKQIDKKKTLREEGNNGDATLIVNDGKGEQTYVGKRAKDILDESDIDDLMLAVKNNASHLVEALCLKFKIVNVCEVRGLEGEFELLKREKYNLQNWNMILVAVAHDHLKALTFFTKQLQCHLRVSLRSPPILGFSKMQESSPQQSEAFSLLVAIDRRQDEILKFLWNDLRCLWDSFHLQYIIEEMAYHRYVEGIRIVLKSAASHEIYQSMRTQDKISFLNDLIILKQSKRSLEVKEALKEELSLQPYATIAVFVMMSDPKNSYTQNSIHLEKAILQMQPIEYARYKYAAKVIGQFMEQTQKRINDSVSQEDNYQQKKFGESLRQKIDHLDSEIVQLKHGFVNATEYDEMLMGLFKLCEEGDLSGFSRCVIDNDVRTFKRIRKTTVKLTQSFAINNFCYFTPLLMAVQLKHLTIVTFIMEKMKIGQRQALCLQSVDGEETFMTQDVNEEYQAYSLLVACANRDEQMLRYLWDTHGTHLWTERHFEPMMRYLIESEWIDGMKIIFRSEITQQMIKAFQSEERSFFIENMIGDLFSIEKPNVLKTLKEELSQKPYAGLFIVYMLDRFTSLADEDYAVYWDQCTNNVYLQELKVLSKTNQSRFCKFILDFMIKRKDDRIKAEALKFIDRLKELPEYEPIIEEGVEEAIRNGDEEIKFLKKDINECKQNFVKDLVRFTIMGNIKQIQTIVEKEKLTPIDIYDNRGFAVKAFDPDQAIINTREWNPIHFAIFFRQLKVLQYFVKDFGINLKIALDYSHTYNEFIDDPSFIDHLKQNTYLYGFLLAIWTRDVQILQYLYEDSLDILQTSDQDLLMLMKICIQSKFSQGFMTLVNSKVTEKIFINSPLDFKEDFVQYILSHDCIESACISSNRTPELVRDIKEKLVSKPYASITWVYLDHQDEKNTKFLRLLMESFDQDCMEILSKSGQLEKLENKILRPHIGLDFLAEVKNEEEKKEMEENHQKHDLERKKLQEHQRQFTSKIDAQRQSHQFGTKQQLNDICQTIVEDVLNNSSLNEEQKLETFNQKIEHNNQYLQFIDGYYNFAFWRKHPKLSSIDMDKLNVLHWVLFFNQSSILENILIKLPVQHNFHLGLAFHGDHASFEYEYQEKQDNQPNSIRIQKLGVAICILNKSLNCWDSLLKSPLAQGLLTSEEILDVTLMICAEDWNSGLISLVPFIEQAFSKISLIKRVDFILRLLKIKTNCFKDVVRIEKLLTFVEWMYDNYSHSEQLEFNAGLKVLLPSFQANKDRELQKIGFLARFKPLQKVEQKMQQMGIIGGINQMPNDIINLGEIEIKVQEKRVSNKKVQQVKAQSANQSEDNDPAEVESD